MIIFLCAAMGRSSVKFDHRVNQPLKVVKGPSIPFCGMSAWNWEPVTDKSPIALFIYYCLYNHYNKSATEWFISHAMALRGQCRSALNRPSSSAVSLVVVQANLPANRLPSCQTTPQSPTEDEGRRRDI
jgi:hypothetical protein